MLAGVNAARRAQDLATVVIPRDSSYLGTLVDDLVTKVAFHHLHRLHDLHTAAVPDGIAAALDPEPYKAASRKYRAMHAWMVHIVLVSTA